MPLNASSICSLSRRSLQRCAAKALHPDGVVLDWAGARMPPWTTPLMVQAAPTSPSIRVGGGQPCDTRQTVHGISLQWQPGLQHTHYQGAALQSTVSLQPSMASLDLRRRTMQTKVWTCFGRTESCGCSAIASMAQGRI